MRAFGYLFLLSTASYSGRRREIYRDQSYDGQHCHDRVQRDTLTELKEWPVRRRLQHSQARFAMTHTLGIQQDDPAEEWGRGDFTSDEKRRRAASCARAGHTSGLRPHGHSGQEFSARARRSAARSLMGFARPLLGLANDNILTSSHSKRRSAATLGTHRPGVNKGNEPKH